MHPGLSHAIKRAPPPLSPPTSLKETMRDNNSATDKSTEGESVMGQNKIILRMGQQILELQGELAQVRNLANLSVTLNTPLEPQMYGHTGAKSQTSTPSHQLPSAQNVQNLPPLQNI